MLRVGFEESRIQRRRSERVAKALPIVVRGVDLLGQEFEERTATLSFNLHGCRYASRYHLPKNTWITLEIARGSESRNARARVAWIERPHSVREYFQISAELETPENIWLFDEPPIDWAPRRSASQPTARDVYESQERVPREPAPLGEHAPLGENAMNDRNAVPPADSVLGESHPPQSSPGIEHPLLRELSFELECRAARTPTGAPPSGPTAPESGSWMAQEAFQQWKREFEEAQVSARERLMDYQTELLGGIRSEWRANLAQAQRLIEEIERNREAESARKAQAAVDPRQEFSSIEDAAAQWRERFQSEMTVAQTQWNELLQTSLDRGVDRLVTQLSQSSQEIAREAGAKLSAEVGELRGPLLLNLVEGRETVAAIRSAADEELARAKSSLAEIERSVSQINGFSAQIDSATQHALEEVNRRLALILDAQVKEMGERAEALTARSIEQAALALESHRQQVVGGVAGEIESRLAPHMERLPGILRDLSAKEFQLEDSLRLHRERLRQASENSERELLAHFHSALLEATKDFDAARSGAAAKLDEDIDSRLSLASQAAAGALEKASQGFEREARGRLQALIEQGLAAGVMTLAANVEDVKRKFASDLEAQSSDRVGQISNQLDGLAGELTARARTQIEQAAEVTATAFGEVVRGISDQENENFAARTSVSFQEQTEQLDASAAHLLQRFETSAESSLARFHQQMQTQLETSIADGRSALSAEFSASLASHRLERDTHEKEWAERLDHLSSEASARYEDRLATAGDSCVVSSVRRLNEHGQNVLESLVRSADQSLRESCAKLFDGFAEILRDRSAHPAAAEAAVPPSAGDSALNHPGL